MKVSVIIPNYNGENLLKANLPRVLEEINEYRHGKTEIMVIDDFSSDESIQVLEEFKKKQINLTILKNEKNLGFSSTVNHGVKKSTGEIIVLLNTDVYPEKNFLDPLLKHFKNEKIFAAGCLDKSLENGKLILRGRGLGEWKRGFLVHRRGEIDKKNTLWVSGGSAAFRKSIWEKLGGFNEIYNPFYWEDIDLSYRALKSGYDVVFEPSSIVVHNHEDGAIENEFSSSEIKTIAYRNQFIFVWENATDLDLQFLHLFWLPYHFVKALLRTDWHFFIGFSQAFILLPKIIKSSLKYQKTFVKRDNEII